MANEASSTAKTMPLSASQPGTSQDASAGVTAQSTTTANASHGGSRNTAAAAT